MPEKEQLWFRYSERSDRLHRKAIDVNSSLGRMVLFVAAEFVQEMSSLMRKLSLDPEQHSMSSSGSGADVAESPQVKAQETVIHKVGP